MLPDEKAIIEYLKAWPKTFISGREIARKACGRRRYEEERDWAAKHLEELLRKGILETDVVGYYRLSKTEEEKRKQRFTRPVAPQILKILKVSGKNFEGIVIDEEEENDAYY